MKQTDPQWLLVAKHLLRHPHITPAEAKEVYGIRRLAARVYDLEMRRIPVGRGLAKDDVGTRYMRYFALPGPPTRWLKELVKENS